MVTEQKPIAPGGRRWRRALPPWIQGLVLVIVFACGMGVGATGASRYFLTRMQYYRAHPKQLAAEVSVSLAKRLDLTSEQSEKVTEIITRRHGRIEHLRQSYAPEIHHEFDLMEQEVSDVLSEDQQRRWHETAAWVRQSYLPVRIEE